MARFFPLRLIPDNTKFNFMGKRWGGFTLSLLVIVLCLIVCPLKGFNWGIDFTGGILLEVKVPEGTELAELRKHLSASHIGEISLQNSGNPNEIMIRVGQRNELNYNQSQAIEAIKTQLSSFFREEVTYKRIDYVGPQVGQELIRDGIVALALAFLGIMLYMWVRFEWQFGVGTLLALAHDIFFVLLLMSIWQLEFNLTSVAAILTIIGYSVNDSVVIYDRIRENMRKYKKMPLEELLNKTINDTLSRTILTVVTTLIASFALIMYGGEAIRSFSITVFFGIIIGTYSSIFISAPVLIYLNLGMYTARTEKLEK